MRWIFLILVGCNIALFAWFQQEQGWRDQRAERAELVGLDTERLQMLSELSIHLRPRADSPAPALPAVTEVVEQQSLPEPAVAVTPQTRCYAVYGFSDSPAAQRFIEQLPASVVASILPQAAAPPGYWVYVRAPGESARRQNLLERLQRDGFEVSVVSRGELKGQLSLGHYQQYDLAYALFQALNAEGYAVDIYEVAAVSSGYTVSLVVNDAAVSDSAWRSLLSSGPERLKSEKKSCQGVATTRVAE